MKIKAILGPKDDNIILFLEEEAAPYKNMIERTAKKQGFKAVYVSNNLSKKLFLAAWENYRTPPYFTEDDFEKYEWQDLYNNPS